MNKNLYLLGAGLLAASLSAQTSWFTVYTNTTVADKSPATVVTADFNNDGKMDIASGNRSSNSISVVLGNGNGSFQSPVNYVVGMPSYTPNLSMPVIATADFNNDGRPDIATGNLYSFNAISVLINNGNGTFPAAVNYTPCSPSSTYASAIATGDFNGDGMRDIAISSANSEISIFMNNGSGNFSACSTLTLSSWCRWITSADFNNDGKSDLAAVLAPYKISVFLGNNAGTFTPGTDIPLSSFPNDIISADLNADNYADIVLSDMGMNRVSVYHSNGIGAFALTYSVMGLYSAWQLCAKDLNNDNLVDLAVACNTAVTVLQSVGSGSYSVQGQYPVLVNSAGLASADFNGDNLPDICAGNADPSGNVASVNQISILMNQSATGTETVSKKTNFIFVRPAQVEGEFVLEMEGGFMSSRAEVFSIDGRQVLSQKADNHETLLDLKSCNSGVYLVQVRYLDQVSDRIRIVKY